MSRILRLQLSHLPNPFSKPKFQVPLTSLFHGLLGRHHGRSSFRIFEILQDNVGVSPTRNPVSGFRTFCTSKGDLSAKKCVPCNLKELRPMTKEAANILITKVDGWNLVNEGGVLKLKRSWTLKSFVKGLEFFKLVAEVAEAEGHHPDLHLVEWNNVTIEIWTHAVGGLTENDFILAAKINNIQFQHLLRRKVGGS
ncbi:pterin-4-alpha-carbinolamine dehydratase 2, mitochondrial isoform X1 [Ziziphus jujuba]|uniref:4a-hydroxytetrahydrobiopterin dehydratase n=1 Tax=Ziziphus jujuba TaxID=326968 RepID=A0A6P3ZF09_ZIZJJ|nr:pterin-4-alpha-carbinolamine dehydratase 2, mitochondrial isoform X1 [Ziziphus jujuba]